MKNQPSVCIIISNYNGNTAIYNGKDLLYSLFTSLKKTKYQNYKIIMADDNSTDKSAKYVKEKFPYVKIIRNKKNGGFSKNNNNAIKYAIKRYKSKYIVLLNNDIIITDSYWLSKLVETAEKDSKIGIVGCKLIYPNGRIQHAGLVKANYAFANRSRGEVDRGQYDDIEKIIAVTFAVVLIKKRVLSKIGLLDENFFMGYEDADFCLRAIKQGFDVIYNGKIKLIHLEGFTSTNSVKEETRWFMFFTRMRNYAYFSYKQLGFMQRIIGISINILLGSFLTIEGPDRPRNLLSLRLNDNLTKRLFLACRAIHDGKKMFLTRHSGKSHIIYGQSELIEKYLNKEERKVKNINKSTL